LKEALSRFDAAVSAEDAADEARVRAGWVLIQDGRPEEAIARLQAAHPHDDRDLQYWHALFLGRALYAADKPEEAVKAYQAALELYPRAQSAGLGLAIALVRLYRFDEADQVARSVRSAGVLTPDPWLYYPLGDERFTRTWIDSLRAVVR
jgi:tetratricopeptide (TPR) repeat protein